MRVCNNKFCYKLAFYEVIIRIKILDINKPCIVVPNVVVCSEHKKKIKVKDLLTPENSEHLKGVLRVVLEEHKIYEMPRLEESTLEFVPLFCMN